MSMTDPIADMLTRIRNAANRRKESVDIPHSTVKVGIAEVLQREGYINGFKTFESPPQDTLRVFLKYGQENEDVIVDIQRVSKPGRRVYNGYRALSEILSGMGIQIVSTPDGVLSDSECREKKVGGEVLARVH